MDRYAGDVRFDDGEVCEAAWVEVSELRSRVAAEPQLYTQWLLEEAESLGWFGADAAAGDPAEVAAAAGAATRGQQAAAAAAAPPRVLA